MFSKLLTNHFRDKYSSKPNNLHIYQTNTLLLLAKSLLFCIDIKIIYIENNKTISPWLATGTLPMGDSQGGEAAALPLGSPSADLLRAGETNKQINNPAACCGVIY
jgi:hypothetical protein